MNSSAFFSGAFVIKLTPTNRIVDRISPQIPEENPKGLIFKSSRTITVNPLIMTLVKTPWAVPLRQKNAPIRAGTKTNNPAEDATDNTAIKFNCNFAKKKARIAMIGMTIFPTASCIRSV